jgi:polyphosphate kinase
VELLFPVEDPALAEQVRREVLGSAARDSVRARLLTPDGTYVRHAPQNGERPYEHQTETLASRRTRKHRAHAAPPETPPTA